MFELSNIIFDILIMILVIILTNQVNHYKSSKLHGRITNLCRIGHRNDVAVKERFRKKIMNSKQYNVDHSGVLKIKCVLNNILILILYRDCVHVHSLVIDAREIVHKPLDYLMERAYRYQKRIGTD